MLDRLELLVNDKLDDITNLTIVVVGLGGVGGYTVESLVRCGIKRIIIVDYDTIDITNLNRQIISKKTNIGLKKVDEWELRIKEISDTEVVKLDLFLDKNNIDTIFKYNPDFVIDACDTVNTKLEIINSCLNKKIKFISSMGVGNRMDPQKLKIEDIKKTSYDPLSKKLRKLLKENHIEGKIPVVYSKEEPIKNKMIGSNSFVPAFAGLLLTSYVINEVITC